ncbi:CpaF family protein [Acidimicrobiia bacterium EGI L10123]|uniref:CpaF family protein n=1 Tax=Salinilacustrithrix flava TaxID=2957203 RepID=UPI003D7C22FC|nr:CpaF family protein [Acidimicrobiia bacterium EGI L10123]
MKLSEKLAALEEAEGGDDAVDAATPAKKPAKPVTKQAAKKAERAARDGATSTWDDMKRKVRTLVLEEMADRIKMLDAEERETELREALDRILQREDISVTPIERRRFVAEMVSDTLGYGPLDPLLAEESITEVMCNAYDDIWVERDGRIERTDTKFIDDAQYRQVIDKIVSSVGRRVDESSPMVDARLPDGSRVNAIIPPLAINGSVLTIRKFAKDPFTAKDLINFGTWTMDLVTVMEAAVRGKLNVLVSGGTGTGKTTNLNVLSSFIPDGERIITIEDSAELQLQQPHVITLETRPANAEGSGQVTIRELVKNSLRMRPDRIIVGECRAAEALDMLQAMNTGHEGSMTTVHANTARDAISRLETMVLMAGFDLPVRAIREQIASALHLILQVTRLPDGRRVITSLTEVQGMEGDIILLQDVFKYESIPNAEKKHAGELVATGLRPKFVDKLIEQGVEVPAAAFRAPRRPQAPAPSRRSAGKAPKARDIADKERLR